MLTAEVEQLRRENKELTATLAQRNARITELEIRVLELTADVDELVKAAVHEAYKREMNECKWEGCPHHGNPGSDIPGKEPWHDA